MARQSGMTLIELVMFIVVVSVGLAGILAVLTISTQASADPMIRKNMLAIAEALMEEVQAMPFTYCDPDDANATTAANTTGCASTVEGLGIEGPETTRTGNPANPFDNVSDYWVSGGLNLSPITDISGGFSAPAGYTAKIQLVAENLSDIVSNATPATMEALRIAVTVTHGNDSLTLEGYRTRHSPNTVP